MVTSFAAAHQLFVLGLDPSTGSASSAVGAVVVKYSADLSMPPTPGIVIARAAILGETASSSDDSEAQLWHRLYTSACCFSAWVRDLDSVFGIALDIIAFERPFVMPDKVAKPGSPPVFGNKDTALKLAYSVGSLLSRSSLAGNRVESVSPTAAKAAARCSGLKREEGKAAVKVWARSYSSGILDDCTNCEQEAIADALAVAEAAYLRWRKEETSRRGYVKPLFGKGSRGPRQPRAVKAAEVGDE